MFELSTAAVLYNIKGALGYQQKTGSIHFQFLLNI